MAIRAKGTKSLFQKVLRNRIKFFEVLADLVAPPHPAVATQASSEARLLSPSWLAGAARGSIDLAGGETGVVIRKLHIDTR